MNEPEKVFQIRQMFGKISPTYDLTNTILSLGVHHIWRKQLVNWSGVASDDRVLDCATGTGDLALAFSRKLKSLHKKSRVRKVVVRNHVTAIDFCKEMLELGPQKALKAKADIQFQQADVCALPYGDNDFDLASIAFGLRNVPDRIQALTEMARVVRPGGLVLILEFGQVHLPLFEQVFKLYSKYFLPKIGGYISGKPEAYQYLNDTAAVFPCGRDLAQSLRELGLFQDVQYRPLSGGIAYIYKARLCPNI